ncbi:putative uncharacterized protein DDB_G0287457 [Daktulosphaira vitifoliae]|uniref:putative uncharacterized protein DDB_G0287457 n=1 Tax=Daktulosphaira vitifoliae TaxID=58002 RepID=UPI0021AAC46D|nr:putative uncharacterized protein DDB_G0287457 [Daktulosphaira vitifoliae]
MSVIGNIYENSPFIDEVKENDNKNLVEDENKSDISSNKPNISENLQTQLINISSKSNYINNFKPNERKNVKTDANESNSLSIRRIFKISLKSELVLQKLTAIDIKPDKMKNLNNRTSNTSYRELIFDSKLQTCIFHSSNEVKQYNAKNTARNSIQIILSRFLKNYSSYYILNDHILIKLQILQKKLEFSTPDRIEQLIKEHISVELSDSIIIQRLIEIANDLFESINDEVMSEKLPITFKTNNYSRQVLNRLDDMKKLFSSDTNSSMKYLEKQNNNNKNMFNKNKTNNIREFLKQGNGINEIDSSIRSNDLKTQPD